MLDRTRLAAGQVVTLPNGAAEITFELTEPQALFGWNSTTRTFALRLAQHEEGLEILHAYLDRQKSLPARDILPRPPVSAA